MKQRKGTRRTDRPRICVFRSNRYIYAQIIDDVRGVTLVSASDYSVKDKKAGKKDQESKQVSKETQTQKMKIAYAVGQDLAQKASAAKITKVWFDRGNYKYHGRIKALAEGARSGGLQF